MENKKRCHWCNLKNKLYVEYHDKEWCVPNFDDKYLYEMLILESFQAGLSWECVLNKREGFNPGVRDKITVVIFLEGDDPECVNAILGGEMKMHMDIYEEHVEEKNIQ